MAVPLYSTPAVTGSSCQTIKSAGVSRSQSQTRPMSVGSKVSEHAHGKHLLWHHWLGWGQSASKLDLNEHLMQFYAFSETTMLDLWKVCSIPNENSDQISDHLSSVIVPKWTQLCSSAVARSPSLPAHSPQPLSLSPTPVVLSALLLPLSVWSAHGPPSGSATSWILLGSAPYTLESLPPCSTQPTTSSVLHTSSHPLFPGKISHPFDLYPVRL